MVRDTLGEDAVIIATREEQGGKAVRVTAAIEPAFELGRNGEAAAADDWLQYDDEHDEGGVAEELTDVLLRHAVPEDIMDQIISCATIVGLEQPGIAMVAAIEHLFNFRPIPQGPEQKAMMLVGPPGAGKTLVAAKLATRAVMNGLSVGVISCDTVRAGGIEQLQAFTKLLKVDLQKAGNPKELRYKIADMDDIDQVIIDTAGVNPFDKSEVKFLAQMIGAADIEPYMVLPAGTDAEEAGEMARVYSTIGTHKLIPTRVDIARRMGSILAAAHSGGMIFSDAGNTSKVADGLLPLNPQRFSRLLMPSAFPQKSESSKTASSATRSTHKRTGTRQ